MYKCALIGLYITIITIIKSNRQTGNIFWIRNYYKYVCLFARHVLAYESRVNAFFHTAGIILYFNVYVCVCTARYYLGSIAQYTQRHAARWLVRLWAYVRSILANTALRPFSAAAVFTALLQVHMSIEHGWCLCRSATACVRFWFYSYVYILFICKSSTHILCQCDKNITYISTNIYNIWFVWHSQGIFQSDPQWLPMQYSTIKCWSATQYCFMCAAQWMRNAVILHLYAQTELTNKYRKNFTRHKGKTRCGAREREGLVSSIPYTLI